MEEETIQRNKISTKELGLFAEGIARHYLLNKGYEIIAKNYKFNFGELDIVAKKDEKIIFVEVKAHQKYYEGFEPEMKVDYRKKRKIIGLATAFLDNKKLKDSFWQIDIISIIFDLENKKAQIKHFKNAISDY